MSKRSRIPEPELEPILKRRNEEICAICLNPIDSRFNCCFHIVQPNKHKLGFGEVEDEIIIQKLNSNEITFKDLQEQSIIHAYHNTCLKTNEKSSEIKNRCPLKCQNIQWFCINPDEIYIQGLQTGKKRDVEYVERQDEYPLEPEKVKFNINTRFASDKLIRNLILFPNNDEPDEPEPKRAINVEFLRSERQNIFDALMKNNELLKITGNEITGIHRNENFNFNRYNIYHLFLPHSIYYDIICRVAFLKNQCFWKLPLDLPIPNKPDDIIEPEGVIKPTNLCNIMGGKERNSSRKRYKSKSRQRNSSRKRYKSKSRQRNSN